MFIYYLAIKGAFLLGIARSFVKYEPLQKNWLFLVILYTCGLAFISRIFVDPRAFVEPWLVAIVGSTTPAGQALRNLTLTQWWLVWLGETFLLVSIYFKLLIRFDEGLIFWVLFLFGGLGLVLF
jgi:hypothetical protein